MENSVTHDRRTGPAASLGCTRRKLLLGAAGSLGLIGSAVSQAATLGNSLNAPQQAWRAMSRVGYGPSPVLLAALQAASSPKDWALQQIDAARAASQRPPTLAADLAGLNAPLPEIFAAARRERELRQQVKASASGNTNILPQGQAAFLRRMDFSAPAAPEQAMQRLALQTAAWRLTSCSQPELENPLLARLTEFWFNHLNVFIGKGAVRPFVGHYLVNVIRTNALGKFEDLLLASARHPAMLLYLDQAQSVAEGSPGAQGKTRGLNENYARELMELHTLGVNGGYTQTDVRELARVLTGWTIGPTNASGFRFAPRLHDNGSKRVLGQTFPTSALSAGEQEGVEAIRLLARQPATAQRICMRLAQFFVADKPAPALVTQLKDTFLASQGDIGAVMRSLLASSDFWAQDKRLFKTPMDFACSALAATQSAADTNHQRLVLAAGYLSGAGLALHGWQTPDGYPFDAATWLVPEALTRRADFAFALARGLPALEFLQPYLGDATRDSIAHERPALQAGLMLASPDFMYK